MQSTQARNIAILKATLDRHMPNHIAKIHSISEPSIGMCIRDALQCLQRYGAENLPITADKQILFERKDDILKAIKTTKVPKTTISPAVHSYLKERFGEKYPRKAKQIAAAWGEEVSKAFSTWNQNRERNSLLAWLASEGYYPGDYLDEHYTEILFQSLGKNLEQCTSQEGVTISIEQAKTSYDKKSLVVGFTMDDPDKKLHVKRRLKIDIL